MDQDNYEINPPTGGQQLSNYRRVSLVANEDHALMIDEDRPKTRRVNPQRLALRLGPELVAEMEALIVPGAKMPTFATRKDFQERYCVDRRHIYDYFHSRGLRVAKEDKHTNLKRGRSFKVEHLHSLDSELSSSSSSHTSFHSIASLNSQGVYRESQQTAMPRRAETYPNNKPFKRRKRLTSRINKLVEGASPPVSPTLSKVWTLSASNWHTPTDISASTSLESMAPFWQHEENGSGSDILSSGTSITEELPEVKTEDFMLPLGSSTWALDLCDSLYALADGEYYGNEVLDSAGYSSQVQGYSEYTHGHDFSDFLEQQDGITGVQVHVEGFSGKNAESKQSLNNSVDIPSITMAGSVDYHM